VSWRAIIGGLLVVLAGAIAAVLAVGARLPVGHVAARRMRLSRPPEQVWQALTDVEAFPTWRPGVKRVELVDPSGGSPTWREFGRNGTITFETVEAERPRRLVVRIADTGLAFGGDWTYLLEPDGDGCILTVTEHGEVYNIAFRFLSRFVFGNTATMDAYLRALGARYGEVVTPQPATPTGR
jgi:uncharacterized protein YndB with AHSA1/START domain